MGMRYIVIKECGLYWIQDTISKRIHETWYRTKAMAERIRDGVENEFVPFVDRDF